MSLTALHAKIRRGGTLYEVAVGAPGHDRALLIAEASKIGDVVDLGHVYEAPDSHDPVRPCGHGSAEYTRSDGWMREAKPTDIDYIGPDPRKASVHPAVRELERIHDL